MTTDPGRPATAQGWRISRGDAVAEVARAGAALASYSVGGVPLTEPAPVGRAPDAGNGQLLVPWPNRVRDGRWPLAGTTQQLTITEESLGNAHHGFVRRLEHEPVRVAEDAVTLRARVPAQPGYPFALTHTVTYALSEHGLDVTHEVTHDGPGRAPVAVGAHPYLRVGEVPLAECTLRIEADAVLVADDQKIPVAREPVGGVHDWRSGPVVADRRVDQAYTDLTVREGRVHHTLRAPDGRGVRLWAEAAFGWVQVFTTDRLPGRELAVAVEPMTAPADAFNSGEGLAWLAEGETLRVAWGLEPVG